MPQRIYTRLLHVGLSSFDALASSRPRTSCSTTPLSGNTCSLRRQRCRRAEVAEERASERAAHAADVGDGGGVSLHDASHAQATCSGALLRCRAPLAAAQRSPCWTRMAPATACGGAAQANGGGLNT
jgi:hypothetical protein